MVLPDIRSTHNTGSFFRTADGAGIEKIYLTGYTATPPHPHLVKVSLGAEQSVSWEQVSDPVMLARQLQADGFQCVGVEQTSASVDYRSAPYADAVALWFGNEVEGLSPELQQQMDLLVALPMHGAKESLNVSVVGGIMLYHLTHT